MKIELIYDGLKDCVICQIVNTDIVIIVLYIPPINSTYFDDNYFMNLEIIITKNSNHIN